MSGGLALRRPRFPSNVHFASQIQANQLSIHFGTASKQGEHGDGPLLLCTLFMGLELAIMIVLIGSKPCLGKGSLRNSARRSKFGTSCVASCFGPFGLNTMTMCSIMNDGTSPKSNIRFEMK